MATVCLVWHFLRNDIQYKTNRANCLTTNGHRTSVWPLNIDKLPNTTLQMQQYLFYEKSDFCFDEAFKNTRSQVEKKPD